MHGDESTLPISADYRAPLRSILMNLSATSSRAVLNLLNRVTLGNLPPLTAVAAIVERNGRILMIARNDGLGLCLPGGLMRWNESAEAALHREVLEETGYTITIDSLLGVCSNLDRDPRFRCIQIVYCASIMQFQRTGKTSPEGKMTWVPLTNLPDNLAFDHTVVVAHYLEQGVPRPGA